MKLSTTVENACHYSVTVIAWLVGGTLAYAALGHGNNPMYFLGSVMQYDLLAYPVAIAVAAIVPWIELSLGLMLIFQIERRIAFVLTSILSLSFVVAQISAIARGLKIDCGCFGSLVEREVGTQSLLLAVGMFAASVIGGVFCRDSLKNLELRNLKSNSYARMVGGNEGLQ